MAFNIRSSYSVTPTHQVVQSGGMATPSAPMEPCSTCPRQQKVLVCWSPKSNSSEGGVVSCTLEKYGDPLIFSQDHRAAIIPARAIIDSVEFYGTEKFSTKDVFSIGLGQLNQNISFPLVVKADPAMANEVVGGCREFISTHSDGRNEKSIVLVPSYVNLELGRPITSGLLQVVIRYHMKIV